MRTFLMLSSMVLGLAGATPHSLARRAGVHEAPPDGGGKASRRRGIPMVQETHVGLRAFPIFLPSVHSALARLRETGHAALAETLRYGDGLAVRGYRVRGVRADVVAKLPALRQASKETLLAGVAGNGSLEESLYDQLHTLALLGLPNRLEEPQSVGRAADVGASPEERRLLRPQAQRLLDSLNVEQRLDLLVGASNAGRVPDSRSQDEQRLLALARVLGFSPLRSVQAVYRSTKSAVARLRQAAAAYMRDPTAEGVAAELRAAAQVVGARAEAGFELRGAVVRHGGLSQALTTYVRGLDWLDLHVRAEGLANLLRPGAQNYREARPFTEEERVSQVREYMERLERELQALDASFRRAGP